MASHGDSTSHQSLSLDADGDIDADTVTEAVEADAEEWKQVTEKQRWKRKSMDNASY